MTRDDLPTDDLIEIRDPEIDPAAIMAQIRERMRQRRAELGYARRSFPAFATIAYPEEPEDLDHDPNLYHHLRMANEQYMQAETGVALAPSPATRVPILGKLWGLIRRSAHELVLYYVNRAVAHQVNVNRQIISALNRLAVQNEERQRAIEALEAEVEALREQLAELKHSSL